jgi:6-phosphogluconolactonase/glucosamine-6-phosphate isomerase/deaminase
LPAYLASCNYHTVCKVIVAASQAAVASRGLFTVAFSGGSLPKIVAKALLQCTDEVDFSKVARACVLHFV